MIKALEQGIRNCKFHPARHHRYLFRIIILACFLSVAGNKAAAQNNSPRHEFRGVWIASVDNIDWPLSKGLPSDSQKAQFIRQLDLHKSNGMNAIIMQVRPAADALYPSTLEPWSEWLTGVQGKPPSPYYDPLQFMIEETHKRGMEFHAWCNPYRAVFQIGVSSVSPSHITRMHPEWFLDYGGKRYFDPGNKEAQAFVNRVVADIVGRYEIDAVHFDDYFYPYRIKGASFPDTVCFKKYGAGMNLDDWRRSNVDSIILALSRTIRQIKPACRFGISPFGVWRNADKDPEGSLTKASQTNYDDLFADILLWLKMGWIDYVAPQLYWEFGHAAAPYEVLIDWWSRHSYGKPCYIGIGYYKAGINSLWRDKTLLPRQMRLLRQTQGIHGAVFFSSRNFLNNPLGWNDSLRNDFFRYPALIAPMPGLETPRPLSPEISRVSMDSPGQISLTVVSGALRGIRQVGLYRITGKKGSFKEAKLIDAKPFRDTVRFMQVLPADPEAAGYFVTYINELNQESDPEADQIKPVWLRKKEDGSWTAQ
jgi:uncharacterized lipoprotein YddW (UPF0748 family)